MSASLLSYKTFTGVGRCIHFSKLHRLFIAPQLNRTGIAQNSNQTMPSLIFRLSRTASNKSWEVGPGLRLGDARNQLFYSWTEVAYVMCGSGNWLEGTDIGN